MSIENTQDPSSMELTSMLLLATGDTEAVIGAQERAGQAQVIHSDCLPTAMRDSREEFEAVGFTFGQPDPHDPLFAPATLPDGWKREGSDHAMWSYIVDELGRRRVGVFYKAASYDRKADMHLVSVYGYVRDCVYNGTPIVTDDTWASRTAVAEALRKSAQQAEERVTNWQRIADRDGPDETSTKYIAEYAAERDKYQALVDEYAA
ncbi:hypothetical protein [Streptomyces sp. NPDC020298]|uniref:hypothetical protein n=1 Tax=unclassified Streptomyces TaxID=2593676 RepID=UPI0033DF3D0F